LFLEVLEDLKRVAALSDGVGGRVVGPNKLLSLAKALVPQRHRGVDNKLTITTDHHKPVR